MSDHHHERMDVLGSLQRGRDGEVAPSPGALPEGAAQTVREARTEDAPSIGAAQADTLAVSLASGLSTEEASLPPEVRAALDPAAMTEGWRQAIMAPPSPRHRVMVALQGQDVVGFAAIAPAVVEHLAAAAAPVDAQDAADVDALPEQDPLPSGPQGTGADETARQVMADRAEAAQRLGAEPATEPVQGPAPSGPERRMEIIALEVPAQHGREGHGSRLMSALVDLARDQGTTVLQTWAVQGEESRARFLDSCGFAPMGLRREAQIGERSLVEICWEAAI